MPASDELRKLYKDAQEFNIFVKEFPAQEGFMAFAGSLARLENTGFTKEARKKMDFMQASLFMTAGAGESREEAVQNAINLYKQAETWGRSTKNVEG